MAKRRTIAFTAVTLLALAGTAAGIGRIAGGAPAPVEVRDRTQPVRVTTVSTAPVHQAASYTGTVRPRYNSDLGFRVSGKIVARAVDPGERVTKGQVLARLDESDYRLALLSAEDELAAAKVDLARSDAELGRRQKLFEEGHVARAALDQVESGLADARARHDRAVRARDQAANQVDYTTLTATEDGVVRATGAEVGQVVASGQIVVSVARVDALDAEIALPEQKRHELEGAVATAVLWGEDIVRPLALREVSPDVDPASRSYRVLFAFEEVGADLSLGRTVTVSLSALRVGEAARLPLAAVLNDAKGAAVWKVADGGVSRVPVSVLTLDESAALVQGNLHAGDQVVSLGAHKIDPGRPVRIVETEATPQG